MSFSYDVTTDAGKVRLLLSDTSASSYVFEDDEISAFLSLASDNVHSAAAFGCRSLAVNHAKRAIWYRVNGFEMDRRDPAKRLQELADTLDAQARSIPWELESLVEDIRTPYGGDASNYPDTEA